MKTNFQMVKELDRQFTPKRRGVITGEEVDLIAKALCVEDMDVLALRNLRDFTVMFLGEHSVEQDEWKRMDKVSAITAVIDEEIWKKGGEV